MLRAYASFSFLLICRERVLPLMHPPNPSQPFFNLLSTFIWRLSSTVYFSVIILTYSPAVTAPADSPFPDENFCFVSITRFIRATQYGHITRNVAKFLPYVSPFYNYCRLHTQFIESNIFLFRLLGIYLRIVKKILIFILKRKIRTDGHLVFKLDTYGASTI